MMGAEGGNQGWESSRGRSEEGERGGGGADSFLGGFFGPIGEIDIILNDGETQKIAQKKSEDGKVEKTLSFL